MKTNLTRTFKLIGLQIKKHSPEIMVVAGAVGAVGATVMACKATTKLNDTLDECKARKEEVENNEAIPEEDKKKELAKVTIKNAGEIAKLYAPAFVMEVASISIIFASNSIQRKRNASLAAAYATLDAMFKKYRKNVIEAFGEDVDRDMRFGVKHEEIEEVEVDEKGKEKKVKKTVDIVENPNDYSEYARFYDETCKDYHPSPEYARIKLKANQVYANRLLRIRGYMTLNEVYEIIGLQKSQAGYSVGWIYDDENDIGDGYIDFGIFNCNRANRRFVNGLEPVILLDFNVDGDIMNNPKLNKLLRKHLPTV